MSSWARLTTASKIKVELSHSQGATSRSMQQERQNKSEAGVWLQALYTGQGGWVAKEVKRVGQSWRQI